MTIRSWSATALQGAVAVSVLVALGAVAPSAHAATSPSIMLSDRTFSGSGSHVITVTGRDYLVPPHAAGADVFGGIYLFFGWVKPGGGWGPSNRSSSSDAGTFGSSYAYPGEEGDAGTRDPGEGGIRFISFTSGGASGATTDEHMDDSGGWRVQLEVPGPTFRYTDSTGASRTVDCRKLTCGVFTMGAHGKASATNEVFTPVTFRDAAGTTPTAKPTRTPKPAPSRTSATPGPTRSAQGPAAPAPSSSPATAAPSSDPTTAAPEPTTSAAGAPAAPSVSPSVSSLAVDAASATPSGGSTAWLLLLLAGAAVVGVLVAVVRRPGRRREEMS